MLAELTESSPLEKLSHALGPNDLYQFLFAIGMKPGLATQAMLILFLLLCFNELRGTLSPLQIVNGAMRITARANSKEPRVSVEQAERDATTYYITVLDPVTVGRKPNKRVLTQGGGHKIKVSLAQGSTNCNCVECQPKMKRNIQRNICVFRVHAWLHEFAICLLLFSRQE